MNTMLPRALGPPSDPPTAALPPLPTPKTRKSLTSPGQVRLPSAPQTPSKLRIPSTPTRRAFHVPAQQTSSTPAVPTLRSAALQVGDTSNDRNVRRSVSIAAFPQPPPNPISRIGKPGGRPSLGSPPITTNLDSFRSTSAESATPTTPVSSADSAKPKKLKRPAKSPALGSAYAGTPSLLNGSGGSVAVSAVSTSSSAGGGFLNLPSPAHSRSSSAQGSYSTQATQFEEDEVPRRGRDDAQDGSEQSSLSGREAKGNVVVGVRVRPDAGGDATSEGEWMVDGRRSLIAFRGKEGGDYYYDNVFASHDDNGKVYDASAKRLVRRVMEGYHGTVFAYGMTGTGKTFSMQGTTASPGVIPRAITDIFSFIRETPHREFLLRASYLEIYNEDVRDLLAPLPADGTEPEKIKLREDSKRGVYVTPLREEIVQSPMQLLRVISRGDRARHVGTTQFNAHSSRSHAVVKIVVESRDRAETSSEKRAALGPGGVRVSTLSLIDLAGSEKAADSKERRKEGAHINKSLLTLGTVVARLSGGKDKNGNPTDKDGRHLPYRDSKLTRLLQQALSGDSLISILCTIQIGSAGSAATANTHTAETLNTLKFAARAKNNIVSHARKADEALGVAADPASRGLLERYRSEIQTLKQQLEHQNQLQLEKEEKQLEKDAEARHNDQMLELQLARTALKERIEHLNRLILSSQSQGVNASGSYSSLSMHPPLLPSLGTHSARSSTSLSTVHRTASGASTATIGHQLATLREASVASLEPAANVGDEGEENVDGTASVEAQNRALRSDLTEKTKYISALERRLIQARRTSNSRTSGGFSLTALQEKDIEIAELRIKLEERDRTIAAFRSVNAASRLDVHQPTASSNLRSSENTHQPKGSFGSSITTTTNSTSLSPVELPNKRSPFEILGGAKASTAGTSPSNSIGLANGKGPNRKSIDEMSRMLDEMIQEKVEKGELVADRKNGTVRAARERRQESIGNVPVIGALGSKVKTDGPGLGLGVQGIST